MLAVSRQARLDAIVRAMADRIGAPAGPEKRRFTADQWPPLIRPPVVISDEQLAAWRAAYPDHPDLLREAIGRAIERAGGPDESHIELLERYAVLRPVDPYPHRKLTQIYRASDRPEEAIEHLEALDLREERSAVYAIELARLYEQIGELDRALAQIMRAAHIDPYHAPTRERAAAIAIRLGNLPLARTHIVALTLLEPDRPQHERRLEAIDAMLSRGQ
jgi:tetratricopeptide (TPR) repeat protein